MYDTREKALRDQQWLLNSARREGREEGLQEGEVRLIQELQEIAGDPVTDKARLLDLSRQQLQLMIAQLRARILQLPAESSRAIPDNL